MTNDERRHIAEILSRCANEVAMFASDYRNDRNHFGSVALALTREISRLRELAEAVVEHGSEEKGDA